MSIIPKEVKGVFIVSGLTFYKIATIFLGTKLKLLILSTLLKYLISQRYGDIFFQTSLL